MSMGDIWGWGGSTHGRMGREHGGGVMYNICRPHNIIRLDVNVLL